MFLRQRSTSIKMAAGEGVPQLGGYHYEFVDEVPDKLKCAICLSPLKNPMQIAKCGHRFCKLCIDPILSKPLARCPVDIQRISEVKVFEDTACKREVLELDVKCPSAGCRWSGELRHVESHEQHCPFKLLMCGNEGCEEEVMSSRLLLHMTMNCKWREVTCFYCNEMYTWINSKEHKDSCSYYPLPCVNGCDEDEIPRNEMTAHVTTVCPAAVVPCKYEHVGCQVKIRRDALQDHVKESVEEHLDLACAKLKQLEDHTKESTDKSRLDLMCAKLEQLEDSVNKLEACEKPLQMHAKSAGLLKAPSPTHYVPFVWKIGGFEEHLQKAKLGFPKTMSSDPFYTSPQGYKMRLQIYPNGQGGGKGSHLSVYIAIMKGEYDNILTWPFKQKIELTLIDQNEKENNRNNLSKSFTPDLTMENFKKPDSQENLGRGYAEFVSHEVLQTRCYIVDNTIFLKVEIG